MGMALDTISGRVDSVAATLTTVTNNTGDSTTIRNFNQGDPASIIEAWVFAETASTFVYRSPRLHDNLQNFRARVPVTAANPLFPYGGRQHVEPQDNITVQLTSGAADQTIESILVHYSNLPGINAMLATWAQIADRIKNICTIETTNVSGATVGDYGGAVALNAGAADILKANVNYALLGFLCDTAIGTVSVRGVDTGNLRVSGPGSTDRKITQDWFKNLSDKSGLPCIPIINAANKANTFVDIMHATAGTSVLVDTIWAELAA